MARKKFSPQFERDYQFYLNQKDRFTFSGSDTKVDFGIEFPGDPPLIEEGEVVPYKVPYDSKGKNAKVCFLKLDSEGRCGPCSEPQLLMELLRCKGAVNLQIKTWAQGRAEYTLPLFELQEYLEYYQAPEWVLKAVENQKAKILGQWVRDKSAYTSHREIFYFHMGEALEGKTEGPVILQEENSKENK